MSKLTSDISTSLDGFITDPNASVGTPLEGNDPGRLHDWRFDAKTDADAELVAELYASTGAVLIGKRMFDAGFEPWGDPPPFGRPVFVLTHETRDPLRMQGGTTYHFVDGIEACLEGVYGVAAPRWQELQPLTRVSGCNLGCLGFVARRLPRPCLGHALARCAGWRPGLW